ncbi:putative membrane protein (TIGR04086 family) [Caldalkalibacillus uzonensis]|uniref:Membrane protein (TIGR04086 family) n=1 Tax=Caldalkalibacillus uzonensis TaxID=353224 RepID=A0ABU0CSW8_9BACI|nr:TIGR04086 family membrane protein [Caldalkalibacillus uzonensis]MDQ0339521.1 putative membrane protein (TIGR04086 family) [Caldalkalibacillus uzonensis]
MGKLSLRPVLMGLLFIIMILLSLSLIFSLVLHFTSVPETSLQWFLLPTTLITVLIGGLIAGYQSGRKGWYFGGLTGLGFIVLSWLFSFLGYDASVSLYTLMLYSGFLLIAMLGGIIGVNLSPQRR